MYKTKLQELCHRNRWSLPAYSSMKDGPDHNPRFKSSVSVNGLCFHSSVSCKSSKDSQNDAAQLACLHFTSPPPPPPPLCSLTNEPHIDQGLEIQKMPQRVDNDQANISGNSLISSAEIAAGGPNEIQSQASANKYDLQFWYKTLLQNYAQRRNLESPKYSSVKSGPAHALCFKATVTVDGRTFDSIEFFKNLKQAEQAAAKVALMSLASDGFQEDDYAVFYKTLLYEFSKKEDLPVPLYQTIKCGEPHTPTFFSMVEVEGEVFYGMVGRSKKEAEMKAAKVAYTALIERPQKHSIRSLSPPLEADETPISSVSSDLAVTIDSQNLNQKCEKDSEDYAVPSLDNLIGKKNTRPALPKEDSSASPPATELDVSALSLADSGKESAAAATETSSSYLLCNRVRVYSRIPDIAFTKGITVMPISDNKWVAVSLEFPNEGAN